MVQEISKGKGKCNEEALLDLLDELDLHAFSEIQTPEKTKSNALIESLSIGLNNVLDYAYNDGFINIRAVIKRNNVFEIENEVAQLNLVFFKHHLDNPKLISHLYLYLMDLLQLSNFLEIFDFALDNGDPPQTLSLFNFVLTDPRFKSLFSTSMEFQKYIFVNETLAVAEQESIPAIIELLKQEPYETYLKDIDNDNYGEEYTKKTIIFLKELAKKKLGVKKKTTGLDLEEIKIELAEQQPKGSNSLIKIIST